MNVEQALAEFGVQAQKGVEKLTVKCPFHNDNTTPNGQIHPTTGLFKCWACKKVTSLEGFLERVSNLPIYLVKRKLGVKTDVKHPYNPQEIEFEHIKLQECSLYLHELHHRCITDAIIRKYRIGLHEIGSERRISIPIMNEVGEYATRLLYIPGAKERKFILPSGKDRTRTRLAPIDQIEFDTILICGGVLKAYAAAEVLNKYDIGAISPTCSESDWPNELTDRFKGKLVYINCDVDEVGKKYSELRCRILKTVAREVHKVSFTPEQVGNLEHGDLNDFIRLHPASNGDTHPLYQLLIDSPEWVLIPGAELTDDIPRGVSFRDAFSHDNVGSRVQFTGIVSGITGNPYDIPELVEVCCGRDQKFCMLCDVNAQALNKFTLDATEMKIGREHQALLALIGENTDDHDPIYRKAFKIPKICRVCTFKPKKFLSVMEVRLDEQVEPTSRAEPMTMKIGFLVNGPDNLDSQSYLLTGRHHPSPKTQLASFLISHCEPTSDALDSYHSPDTEFFQMFQPTEWTVEGIENKLNAIYADFEANVTRIYQRRDLHLVYDLAYHSVLHFDFGDLRNNKGWAEVLVVGDTAQGKSQITDCLQKHYGLGYKIDSKNVTPAGLTIGLEKSYNKYFAIYGAMPKNDKKLIIFEELKGMKQETFQTLTEVRSSGYVQSTKIQHKIRRARVRIIANSNPMDRRKIESYTFGIEAAAGVIGTHEDFRRFDLVYIAGERDVNEDDLNHMLSFPPKCTHIYTDDLCQKLILKAWKCEEIRFENITKILESTKRLLEVFGHGPPILDPNSSHLKIARLSAALAARTCSYEDNVLIVRECHVSYIEQFLHKVYSSPSSRLDEKSRSVRDSTLIRDSKSLIEYLKNLGNSADILVKLREIDILTGSYIRDLCGDFHVGSNLMSKLIMSNAITKIGGDRYAKTAEFVKLLETVDFEIKQPDYLKKFNSSGEV